MKPFCDWHIKSKENPDGTTCSAHLAEGRCFDCVYTLENIQVEGNYNQLRIYISSTKSDSVGACQDFKPLPEIVEGLVKLLQENSTKYVCKPVTLTKQNLKKLFKKYPPQFKEK